MLETLPLYVLPTIQSYLTGYDYAPFLSVSNRPFYQQVRKMTRIISVDDYGSTVNFFSSGDSEFRDMILSLIENPARQLKLRVTSTNIRESLAFVAPGFRVSELAVHAVEEEELLASFNISDTLKLFYNTSIQSFGSSLKQVQSLSVNKFSQLQDLRGVSHLSELMLHECDSLQDISMLGGLRRLLLDRCPLVTDVSPLARVYDLSLLTCDGISEISKLTGNSCVQLADCINIKDFSPLKNTKKLDLSSPYDFSASLVQDFATFQRVSSLVIENFKFSELVNLPPCIKKISLFSCSTLEKLENMSSLSHLTLSFCKCVTSVSCLGKVRCLNLEYLNEITTLDGLGNGNYSVTIISCRNIQDYSPLNTVHHLFLEYCSSFTDTAQVKDVSHLTVASCRGFSDVSSLGKVKILELRSCDAITSLQGLEDVPVIEIETCRGISSLQGLGRNRKIVLSLSVSQCDYPPEDLHRLNADYLCEEHFRPAGVTQFIYLRRE